MFNLKAGRPSTGGGRLSPAYSLALKSRIAWLSCAYWVAPKRRNIQWAIGDTGFLCSGGAYGALTRFRVRVQRFDQPAAGRFSSLTDAPHLRVVVSPSAMSFYPILPALNRHSERSEESRTCSIDAAAFKYQSAGRDRPKGGQPRPRPQSGRPQAAPQLSGSLPKAATTFGGIKNGALYF